MTVTTSVNKIIGEGDGVQVDFPYDFIVLAEDHMNVYIDGVLEDPANWSMTGLGVQTGGVVTMATAPADLASVTLLRIVPNTQLIDYSAYGSFPAETHERALDLRVMEAQQQREEVGRSIRFSVDTLAAFDATFPKPIAGRAWKISADGLGVEHTDVDIDEAIAASAASAAAALISENNASDSAAAALISENNAVNYLDPDSIAELRLIDGSVGIGKALVAGYYAAGDGGGGAFYWDAVSVEADNGGTIIKATAVTTGRWKRVYTDHINVKWFGATGDGVADDTSPVQAAIDYVESTFGGAVCFPAGRYLMSSSLTVTASGVDIRGEGQDVSTIVRSGDYGDTLIFTGNDVTGVLLDQCGVHDMGFESTGLTTSGAHILLNGVQHATIEGVYLLQGFTGIEMLGVVASVVDKVYLVFTNIFGGATSSQSYIKCTSAAATYGHPSCGDVFFSNINIRGNTSNQVTAYGLWIESADGLWFANMHVGNTTVANVLFNKTKDENIALCQFTNCIFDACTGYNLLFQGTAGLGEGRAIQFSNCSVKGGGTSSTGVVFATDTPFYSVIFTGCEIWQHLRQGVQLLSVNINKIKFVGCDVRGNSYGSPGVYPGYYLASGVGGISIIGGASGGSHVVAGAAGDQSYGVQILGGGGDNILVTSVDLTLNHTSSILSYATGDNVLVADCLLDVPDVASGANIALPVGAKLVTITGAVDISNISGAGKGTLVYLKFSGALTVIDGSNLSLAGDFITAANSVLVLICDGSSWHEVSRSSN